MQIYTNCYLYLCKYANVNAFCHAHDYNNRNEYTFLQAVVTVSLCACVGGDTSTRYMEEMKEHT